MRALVWKLKAPFKSKRLFLSLSLLLSVPSVCVFVSHRLASYTVWRLPLFPPGCTPSVVPKGPSACCCSVKRLRENFGAALKRRKAQSLGEGVAPGHRGALWFIIFKFFLKFQEKICWKFAGRHQCNFRTGRVQDVEVALMSPPALYVS